jgi:geranylgeranyl diphosphate synthase, type II
MTERLGRYIEENRDAIEAALECYLPVSHQENAVALNDALRYSIFPGGKRWRPVLTLLSASLVGADPSRAMPVACAMEYLHTSSMIFDDLPAMDDAGLRRGRPSLHLAFSESLALLTALALFNQSYALLAKTALECGGNSAAAGLVMEAARCIGADGMIGGQVVDLALQGTGQNVSSLASRNLKTTALLRLTLLVGAGACGASEDEINSLGDFGEALGMAYQICDDLLDELVDDVELGKPAHQDTRHSRSNHVAEFGVEGAHRMACQLVEDALVTLGAAFPDRPAVDLIADAARLILSGMGKLAIARA